MASVIMVQGTASSAGKSLLATALCRIFRRAGYSVAPFKSQNMSLNSGVTPDGREIGRAQMAQAEAADAIPTADMNPILLKPTSDRRSQVVVLGKPIGNMSADEYYRFRPTLAQTVMESYQRLAAEYDVIVVEGAGSPAEINLMEGDLVNMGLAAMIDAPVILIGDIDRGGVFASLYGTIKLLPPEDQARIKGLIINKFRGQLDILAPGLDMLKDLTGKPVLGVLPYERFNIDDEDSLSERLRVGGKPYAEVDVAVIRLPRLSNFTDMNALERHPDVGLRYVDRVDDLGCPDLLVIPGSKNTRDDLTFLQKAGLAEAIVALSHNGSTMIAGICGGYQMLGRTLSDVMGIEGLPGVTTGLGLLDTDTTYFSEKLTIRTAARVALSTGAWDEVNGIPLQGYQIHMGQTTLSPGTANFAILEPNGEPEGAANATGSVWGTYLHGVFDNPQFTGNLLDTIRLRKGLLALGDSRTLKMADKDREYDNLADMVMNNLNIQEVFSIAGLP